MTRSNQGYLPWGAKSLRAIVWWEFILVAEEDSFRKFLHCRFSNFIWFLLTFFYIIRGKKHKQKTSGNFFNAGWASNVWIYPSLIRPYFAEKSRRRRDQSPHCLSDRWCLASVEQKHNEACKDGSWRWKKDITSFFLWDNFSELIKKLRNLGNKVSEL